MTVTRFAPSPTGRLHLGHAYSALFAEAVAKEHGGDFLLRVEDIDVTRCRPEFVQGIIDDLSWLGIQWSGKVMFQSERSDAYSAALDQLNDQGLLYPCFCTRKDIMREISAASDAPHGSANILYPGICKRLSEEVRMERLAHGDSHAMRLDSHKALELVGDLQWHDLEIGTRSVCMEKLGDVVLARKDITNSYHLAVCVDDAAQGVTLVTRGEDLLESTHVHRLLQQLLGFPVPQWHHHSLIRDEKGRRFAKRDGGLSLSAIRASGKDANEIRQELGF